MTTALITESDYKTLCRLIEKSRDGAALGKRLMNSNVIKDQDLDTNTVRLNSTLEVEDLSQMKVTHLKIVLPDEADVNRRYISVFAPLSVLLLGHREGDIISWQSGTNTKEFRIVRIQNQ